MASSGMGESVGKVGRDVNAAECWKERGDEYAEGIEGPYHRHRLAVVEALLPDLAGREVVDFGCGEGVLIRHARKHGAARIVGVDIDPALLARAEHSGSDRLIQGSVGGLAEIERADCVIAANVAAYLTDEDDELFYREVARILPPGGSLVITHSNELFDLFTLNAFTRDFFLRHFDCDASPLLSRPNEPRRLGFNVRENPLAYPHKLARFGFAQRQIEFISPHAQPPLLEDIDWSDIDARDYRDTLGTPDAERWKLVFQCSMFGVRAERLPD